MRGTKKVSVSTSSTARPTLLSLPEEVLETIVDKLCRISWFGDNNKVDMALSCKALLPILSMGHVEMTSPDEVHGERLLLQLTRRLMKQPDKVTHLELRGVEEFLETRRLIELSLLQNLRKLSLGEVAISLAALQPVATRLQQLCIRESRLQGGADGFLNTGWTALTSLTLSSCRMEDQALPAPNLPALEAADIHELHHRGGMLQLHELNGGCPQLTRLACELDSSLLQASEGVRRCSLLNLSRLAHLRVMLWSHTSNLSFDLPASLTSLSFSGTLNDGQHGVDFFWALRVAVKCIREGAQLQTLVCGYAEANLQTVQGGVTLDEQSRLLGWQLSGLKELEVWGSKVELLGALIAVASSMPSLLRLVVGIQGFYCVEIPPIKSASLESIVVKGYGPVLVNNAWTLSPVVLTLLPDCVRLREVLVQHGCAAYEGATVMIRCSCCSPRDLVPMEVGAGLDQALGVRFLPVPEGVDCSVWQAFTVLHAYHAAGHNVSRDGPAQPPRWGCVVVPGHL